jgi:hypothetical protein
VVRWGEAAVRAWALAMKIHRGRRGARRGAWGCWHGGFGGAAKEARSRILRGFDGDVWTVLQAALIL